MQFNLHVLLITGIIPALTVAEPGTHGVIVFGMQGAGVKTPSAALVAAITAGLLGALHIPNGLILTIGLLSITVAADILLALTRDVGITVSGEGVNPNVHCSIAPFVTVVGMTFSANKNS